MGVNVVILVEYMRGFFVDGQDESGIITLFAIILNILGFLYWAIICNVVIYVTR